MAVRGSLTPHGGCARGAIEPTFAASGTQLGATYELRYRLEPEILHLELVGERTLELGLDGADFFDLGWSPLFPRRRSSVTGCSLRGRPATLACGGSRSLRSR